MAKHKAIAPMLTETTQLSLFPLDQILEEIYQKHWLHYWHDFYHPEAGLGDFLYHLIKDYDIEPDRPYVKDWLRQRRGME